MLREENRVFGWSNFYRICLMIALIIPFTDIFIQLALENWAWLTVSVIFSVVILAMIIASYWRPFITLSDGVIRFYLFPIAPIVFQKIRLNEIASFSVKKSSLIVILANGRKARVNLYAIAPSDRNGLLVVISNMVGVNKGKPH